MTSAPAEPANEALQRRFDVVVIGGGVAGLAAALALGERGLRVQLLEARRATGGRAASFRDQTSGVQVDFCQHVGLGCCTNLIDFCTKLGILDRFTRERRLLFIGPDGRRAQVNGWRWLPAPLHLLPSLFRFRLLSLGDRLGVVRALAKLARVQTEAAEAVTAGAWLAATGQSPAAMEQFWRPVLVSALGDELERVALAPARQVFVQGFLAHPQAYEVLVPRQPLAELFGQAAVVRLQQLGISVATSAAVQQIERRAEDWRVQAAGESYFCRQVVLAVPWRQVAAVAGPKLTGSVPALSSAASLASAPITGVHLWFDRAWLPVKHAVLTGRLAQWVFAPATQLPPEGAARRDGADAKTERAAGYCQAVISGSHALSELDKQSIVQRIVAELGEIWPAARAARLLHAQVVTDPHAVFSPDLQSVRLRPSQRTAIPGLFLAGDWTQTGWPATLEGAVRSGYLAAEAALESLGRPERILVPPLPTSLLTRWFTRGAS